MKEKEKIKIFEKINQKIQTQQPLTEEELRFIEENLDPNNGKIYKIIDKKNKNLDLTEEEEKIYRKIIDNDEEFPISEESAKHLNRFKKDREKIKGFEINQITDIHSNSQTFEAILLNNLIKADHLTYDKNGQILLNGKKFKIKDNVIVAITGDIIKDFFDQQNEGLETFLSKNIIKKGKLNNEEAKKFRTLYNYILEKSGINEEMILKNDQKLLGEQGKFREFYFNLFGIAEPHFMSLKEKNEFIKKRNELHKILKEGMRRYATEEYTKIKNILKKHNLGSDKVIITPGNHDLPEIMEEVLGEYIIREGKTKNVSGIKFGNIVDPSNGNFIGSDYFADIYGYGGFREKIKELEINTEAFQKIRNKLYEVGINLTNEDILKYMEKSIERAHLGIGSGYSGIYKEKYIKPEIDKHLEERLSIIEKNIKNLDADIIIQHSMLDDPKAGIEETYAHKLLSKLKPNKVIIHGHIHKPTMHKKDKLIYLNPGSVLAGNSGIHIFDKNKNYLSSLLIGRKDLSMEYKHLRAEELPQQSED